MQMCTLQYWKFNYLLQLNNHCLRGDCEACQHSFHVPAHWISKVELAVRCPYFTSVCNVRWIHLKLWKQCKSCYHPMSIISGLRSNQNVAMISHKWRSGGGIQTVSPSVNEDVLKIPLEEIGNVEEPLFGAALQISAKSRGKFKKGQKW